eukprot:SAG11_NODE_1811_length_4220_cov_3.963601_2_plen_139_part_00
MSGCGTAGEKCSASALADIVGTRAIYHDLTLHQRPHELSDVAAHVVGRDHAAWCILKQRLTRYLNVGKLTFKFVRLADCRLQLFLRAQAPLPSLRNRALDRGARWDQMCAVRRSGAVLSLLALRREWRVEVATVGVVV